MDLARFLLHSYKYNFTSLFDERHALEGRGTEKQSSCSFSSLAEGIGIQNLCSFAVLVVVGIFLANCYSYGGWVYHEKLSIPQSGDAEGDYPNLGDDVVRNLGGDAEDYQNPDDAGVLEMGISRGWWSSVGVSQ